MRVIIIFLVAIFIQGCNTVGPYDASVFVLEEDVYLVNVGTWIGSKRGWPNGNEVTKAQAQDTVVDMLNGRGLPVDACLFMGYTPYEGGHLTITFVAGEKSKTTAWGAFPKEAFDAELRRRGALPLVFTTEGRLQDR